MDTGGTATEDPEVQDDGDSGDAGDDGSDASGSGGDSRVPPSGPAPGGIGGTAPGEGSGSFGRPGDGPGRRRNAGYKGFDRWEYWWEYNKDRFLARIPVGVASGTPTREDRVDPMEDLRNEVLLPALARASRDRQVVIRAVAMLALGRAGRLANFSDLYRGTRDPEREVRKAAMLGLSFLDSEEVAPVLLCTLRDSEENSEVRCFAAAGLGLLGAETAVPFLAEMVRDPDQPADLRAAAAMALGLLPGEDSAVCLARTLSDRRAGESLRAIAAGALGRQGRLEGVEPLLNALRDKSVEVRRSVALALGAVHYRSEAQDALETALARYQDWLAGDSLTRDARSELDATIEDLKARVKSEEARVRRITSGAVRALTRLAEKEADLQTQAFAVVSLGEIAAPEGMPVLRHILEKKTHRLKAWAGIAAGVSGEESFVPYLKASYLRKGEDPSVRAAMAVALGLLKDNSFAEELEQTALDSGEDPDLRGYAVLSLAMMWNPRAHHVLDEILATKGNPSLHRSASVALGLVGRSDSGSRLVRGMEETNDPWIKAAATISLGYLRDRQTAEALAGYAADPSKPFLARIYSVLAVGYIGDRRGSPPQLSKLAWFYNYRIRIAALDRLTGLL